MWRLKTTTEQSDQTDQMLMTVGELPTVYETLLKNKTWLQREQLIFPITVLSQFKIINLVCKRTHDIICCIYIRDLSCNIAVHVSFELIIKKNNYITDAKLKVYSRLKAFKVMSPWSILKETDLYL